MGFFDSKKKTTNNNVTNDYTTTTTDNRYSELDLSEGSVGVSGDVAGALNITATDHGAIAAGQQAVMGALDYGSDSLELGYGLAGEAFDFSKDALTDTIEQVTGSAQDFAQLTQRSLEATQTAYNNANTSEAGQFSQKTVLYLAIVAGLWVSAPVLQKILRG